MRNEGRRERANDGGTSGDARRDRILVVEDERSTALIMRKLLERKLSAEVRVASCCAEARERIASGGFDLVTLDYQLPDGSGLDLLGEIAEVAGGTPVIVVTGHGDEKTAVEAYNLGASGYIIKDRKMDTLLVEEAERALEFRKTINALAESERLYRMLFDNVAEPIYTHDENLLVVDINQAAVDAIGYTPEELIGRNILEVGVLHPEDIPKAIANTRDLLKTGAVKTNEYRLIHKSGKELVARITGSALRDEKGDVVLFTNVARIVTEEKAAEARLKRSEALFRSLFENMGDPLVAYDSNLICVDANHLLLETIGYSREEIVGKNILEVGVIHPDDIASITRDIQRFSEGEDIVRAEHRLVTRDGRVIVTDMSGSAVRDERGDVAIVTCVLRDVTQKKVSDSALQESEERYRVLQENIAEALYCYDMDLTLVDINRETTKLLGYGKDELLGRNILEVGVLHPDDFGIAKRNIEDLLAGKDVGRPRYRFIKKNGEVVLVEASPAVVRDEDGNPLLVTTLAIDVTEQEKARQALESSERRYRALFQDNPCMLFTLDGEGTVLAVNDFGASQLGYEAGELEGGCVLDVFHEDDREAVAGQLDSCVADPLEVFNWQFRKVRKNGDTLWVQEYARAVPDPVDGMRILVVCEDITEQKEGEERLAAANRQLESIIEFLPDATFIINDEKRVIAWNRAMEEMTGVPKADILEKSHLSAAVPFYGEERPILIDLQGTDDDELASRYYSVKRKGGSVYAEVFVPALYGGKGAFVLAVAAPLFDADGHPVGYIESIRDITDRKRADEALKEELEARKARENELKAANIELSGFTHTVSHDLKGPITTTRTGLEVAKDMILEPGAPGSPEEVAELLDSLMETMDTCYKLVNELLALAESGQVPHDVSRVDVGAVVRQCLDSMSRLIDERGVTVEVDPDMGTVLANRTHVYQVFSNLISNAVRHNRVPEPFVEVRNLGISGDGLHRFMIRDRGPGFPESYLDNLFLPFFKAEGGGTVLGLAIVDKVLNVYGGTIEARNEGGALVEFALRDFDGSDTA